MKKLVVGALLMSAALGVGAAYADSHERTVVLWTCTLADGKTEADVQAANARWVKYVNAGLDEGEIRSYVLTTVVGDQTTFLYIDSFPGGKAWLGAREAMKTEEGRAIEKALDAVGKCSHNALYESKQTLPAE